MTYGANDNARRIRIIASVKNQDVNCSWCADYNFHSRFIFWLSCYLLQDLAFSSCLLPHVCISFASIEARVLICCLTDLGGTGISNWKWKQKCLRLDNFKFRADFQQHLYEEQPNRVGILTLEKRQLKKNILEVCKIMILSQNVSKYGTVVACLFSLYKT